MNSKMVSVDFWNTLVHADTNGEKRHEARMKALRRLAREYEKELTDEAIQNARREVSSAFDAEWFDNQRTKTTRELVGKMLEVLAIPARPEEMDELAEAFRESLFSGPPALAEGLKPALANLAMYYDLAIISDTMYSPGATIKRYLEQQDILHYFSAFAFSDEVGVSKPHVKAYRTVLDALQASPENSWHVGDLQRTDITGAKSAGMKAVLYTGISDTDRPENTADYVCDTWEAIADILVSEIG